MTAAPDGAALWQDLSEAKPAVLALDGPSDLAALHGLLRQLHLQPQASDSGALLLGFGRADQAASAALALQSAGAGCGIGADLQDAASAMRLAQAAGAGEALVSEALRDQLVAGLDAELDQNEEVAGSAPSYRLRPCGAGSGPEGATMPTLVMLPLRARPGGHCDPVYGELLTHAIGRALSQNKAWRLISPLSAAAFRHREPQGGELRQRLRASHVIAGSVDATGKQLHLQIELTDAHSGERLWSERLSHPAYMARVPDNPFGRAVAAAVSLQVFGRVLEPGPMAALADLDSCKLLFSAMTLMHRAASGDFQHSQALLEHLRERDPQSGEPHAWMAKWRVMRVARGLSADIQADTRLAQQAADQALQKQGDRSLPLAIDGVVQAFLAQDLARAEAQLTAAIGANPNEALAWLYLSAVHAYQDRGEKAADAAGMAQLLSPLDPMRYYFDSFAAHALLAAGRFSEAIVLASRSMSANNRHLPTLRTLAIARHLNGQEAQAHEAVQALRRLDPAYSLKVFAERYPGRGSEFARRSAAALREAGLPEG
jgi:TolB-like protein